MHFSDNQRFFLMFNEVCEKGNYSKLKHFKSPHWELDGFHWVVLVCSDDPVALKNRILNFWF